MKVLTTTPFLTGAPGESVTCHVRIENDSALPAAYDLRVIGFDEAHVLLPPSNGALAAGASTEVDVELVIPEAIAPGNHAVGLEVRSARSPDTGAVAAVTVSVGSLDRLLLTVNPSTVRGHRRAKFWVDVLNRDDAPLELELGGDATDGTVRVKPPRVTVAPNQRVRARGRITGPIRLFGEPRQLPFTVSARGRSAPTYAPATYQQRPLFPRPLRTFLAVLVALALWASALGTGLLWWTNRNAEPEAVPEVELVDLDGDGVAETPADQLVDTDSDGVPDTPAAEVAAAAAAGGDEEDAGPKDALPTLTVVNGNVQAGKTGQNDGVLVTLTPITLGQEPSPEALAFAGAERVQATKLWPARYGLSSSGGVSVVRQTTTVTDLSEGADGAFLFPEVLIRQTYEVNFAKAGFDSQSFVITPPESGDPVEMEVTLEPSDGALGGTVVGPGGGLGNVAITATDGTLVFNTSSSSEDGSTGRFSLTAVNTPATYTITATLRGYGTEVIQVPLDPGQQRTDLVIEMKPGVGSIIGRVSSGGAALGGATLTVSNGDVTRTSTSLTEGDVGLYTFPQLKIPGTYTVTASAPGYITQTRLITLAGNVTDVDFDLVKTTAAITGVVVSNVRGPLPGASITISRDNLTFTASSAAAPQPGAFTVDDLPPGTYLVRFARFDHAETSQLVTLAAGQVLDLGQVVLTFTDPPVIEATGSVNVTVTDSEGAALRGATVRLLDVSTGELVAELSDPAETQSTFLFERVPIGTYTVQVERRLYRVARQRVSVGLGPQSVTITLFLLGQVSGRVIDSLTDVQLTNYEVSITRLNPDGSETLVERVTVGPNQQPDPLTGRIEFESSPNSLTTGTYRIDVTDPPPGYRVLPDQVVDPSRPGAPVMQFEILPTAEDPIVLNDVEADIFPRLSGRIFKPLLTTPATNAIDFVPIDDDALEVTLTCPGGAATLPATLTDTDAAAPGLDSYEFTPIQLESNNLLGACVLSVSAPGFTPAAVTVDPGLQPTDGVNSPDQIVNVALVAPADPIAGTLTWVDRGVNPEVQRPIDGVNIATEGDVIVGFGRAQGTDPAADPTPLFAAVPFRTVSANGVWRLDGQVFGQSTYSFSDPARFTTGRLTITIDETANRQVAAVQSLVVADLGANGGIQVQMEPLDGSIRGQISIVSVLPPRYTDAGVSATGPGGVAATPAVNPANGSFTISPAAAGTWTVSNAISGDVPATDPRDYTLAPGSATSVTTLVDPAAAVTLPATTYIEYPRLDVRVVDVNGAPIDVNGTTPTITLQAAGGPVLTQNVSTGAGTATFRRLDYNTANPTGAFVNYNWTVAMPGYDVFNATAVVAPNGAISSVRGQPLAGTIGVRAGAKPLLTIRLPRFGSLAGNVVGRLGSLPGDPTENLPLTDPQLTVRARRVAVQVPSPFLVSWTGVNDPPIAAVIDPADPNGFRFDGPPGVYVLEISHPQYGALVAAPAPPPDCVLTFFCLPGTVPRPLLGGNTGYLIQNDVDLSYTDPFVLEIRRMQIDVRVITDRSTNSGVPGARLRLTKGTQFDQNQTSGFFGETRFFDVLPGTNDLVTFRRDVNGFDTHFPVIASLDVPRFSAINNGVVTLTVVMPELGNRVAGTVAAVNSENDPVDLPADVVIDRVFQVPDGDLDGVVVDNNAREAQAPAGDINYATGTGPATSVTVPAAAPPGTPVAFVFDNIAAGLHDLTFSAEAGYTAPSPNPRTVNVINAAPNDIGTVAYRANDVQVVVNVTSAGQPLTTATVRLNSPDVGEVLTPTAAGGTYTFAAVPPELAAYSLVVTDPLHTDVTQTVAVVPDVDGTLTIDVAMTPSGGRITGIAQRDPGTGAVPLAGQGSVQLQTSAGVAIGAPVTPGPTGNYDFVVPAAGSYRVEVSFTGYATRSTAVTGVTLGRTTTAPTVTIPALATASITFTGNAATEPSLAVTVTQPAASGLTPVRAGAVVTIAGLDPDVLYRFNATANGFYSAQIPATTTLDPTPGTTHPFTVALVERSVTVTVLTNPTNTAAQNGATVRLRIPATSTTPLTPTRAVNVYTFTRITQVGAGEVSVAAPGHRSQTATVDPSTAPATATVTLLPLVTISGTVFEQGGTVPVANATVTAVNGTTTVSALTNASGVYSLPNLDVGTWTISSTVLGEGTASATETITATSASAVTRNLTLAPRNATVSFTVNAATPAGALQGATVNVDGVSATTAADGTASVTVPENGPLAWTVSQATRITQSGTVTLSSLTPSVGPLTLIDRPTLTGTVTRGGNPVNNATVNLCPASATSCDATTRVAVVTTGTAGTFSFPVDVGSWQVRATQGGGEGTFTGITVTQAGVLSPTTVTITLA